MKEIIYRSLIELTNGRITSSILRKYAHSRLSRPLVHTYAKFYQINQMEMLDKINSYPTLHEFFTRRLIEEARPIDYGLNTVISPVDGIMEDCGLITEKSEIIVKEKRYSIQEMLGGTEKSRRYVGGTYIILYLSPAHYHRIHSPVDGKVVSTYSLGSKSFPVNRAGLKYGKSTLAKNFRTITELQFDNTLISMVKVGAMFINTIKVTNNNEEWRKGEEAAYFSFGSTVILLFENDAFQKNEQLVVPAEVKMGQVLGTITGNAR